jgi:hypothetical protein
MARRHQVPRTMRRVPVGPGVGQESVQRCLGGGEVVPGGQGGGVVRAQDPLAVGQGPLEQRDRLGDPARLTAGDGEAVPGGQGSGVIRAQDPLAVGQGPLEQRDRLGGPVGLPAGDGEIVPGGQGGG